MFLSTLRPDRLLWAVLLAMSCCATAFAQDPLEQRLQRAEQQFEENRRAADLLAKQNEVLLKLLNNLPESPVGRLAWPPPTCAAWWLLICKRKRSAIARRT